MKFKNLPLFLIIAILLSAAVVAYDLSVLNETNTSDFFDILRELAHGGVLALFAIHLFNLYKKRELSISDAVNKVVQLFLIVVILYSALFILNGLSHIQFTGVDLDNLDRRTWQMLVGTAVITYASTYIFIKILFYFKTLIYYKRRRKTALLYRSFFILTVAFLVIAIFSEDTFEADPNLLVNKVLGDYSLLALINLVLFVNIVLLAFRNSWVTYLSRKSKYVYFGVSILIYFYLEAILKDFVFGSNFENIESHSVYLSYFIKINYNFFLTYNIFSIIYLVLHLPTARVFDRKMKEVQALYNLSVAINTEPDFNKLVLMITNMASEVTESSSTWLEIFDQEKKSFYVASSKRLNSNEIKSIKLSHTDGISGEIFKTHKPILLNEVSKSDAFTYLVEWKPDINSLIAVPLITTQNEMLGIIYVSKSYDYGFDPDDVSMLEAFANQVVIALENTKLVKESIQRERLEQELKIAREVQQKLLPQVIPQPKGYDVDAIAFTANEVGGDYFDFIEKKNQFGVIVADVSGKGTSAAFYMAELKGVIRSLADVYDSPRELLCHANDLLYEQLEKKSFITGSIFSFNTRSKKAKFVRAGHCPLVKYSAQTNSIETYTPKGLGLGLCGSAIFNPVLEELTVEFSQGDIVALYTDGLNEARNLNGDEYGDDKIGEIILANASKTSKEIKDAILDDIIDFSGKAMVHDDMTLAIVKFV